MRAEFEAAGRPFGPSDLLIAAHAGAARVVLMTDNTDEFSRVCGLRLSASASVIEIMELIAYFCLNTRWYGVITRPP